MSIQYLNKDFSQLQQALVNYIKNNYQNYTDFGPSSPGNMFVDLSAYVGHFKFLYRYSSSGNFTFRSKRV